MLLDVDNLIPSARHMYRWHRSCALVDLRLAKEWSKGSVQRDRLERRALSHVAEARALRTLAI